MKIRILIVVFLFLYMTGMLVWWLRIPSAPVTVSIAPGSSAREIAAVLRRAGVISSEAVFLKLAALTGRAKQLKAGTYKISPRSSMFKVMSILGRGRAQYVRVTIPEGFTARQIAELMGNQKIVRPEVFLQLVEQKQLEGYLFPETYFFETGVPEGKVIDRMVAEFRRNFTVEMGERAKELRMSEREALTLASIVEKEAMRAEERSRISGVFHNRLKKRWCLESCATVIYALGSHKERLTFRDTRHKSPYNTYLHNGLPPGPICSPGIASIKAALYPEETEDMYFVADGSGAHRFSRYLSEHLKNKRKKR